MTPEEIRSQLTSTDQAVLTQGREFITELLDAEMLRGSTAENRAATTLAAIGVVAGFAVDAATSLATEPHATWLVAVCYAVALTFLIRGAYYCLRAFGTMRYFMIDPRTVFELQTMTGPDSLKSEIAHKMAQFQEAVGPNSQRLFWLERGQRALLLGVALLALVALARYLASREMLTLLGWVQWSMAILVIAAFMFVDRIIEKTGLWRDGSDYHIRTRRNTQKGVPRKESRSRESEKPEQT